MSWGVAQGLDWEGSVSLELLVGSLFLRPPPHFSASPGRALARLGQMKGYRGPDEGESIGSPGEKLR